MPDVERFAEPLKFLPITYVLCTISGLWSIYTFLHLVPLLQIGVQRQYVDIPSRIKGQIELIVFNYFTAMLLICYAKSILTHPGEIPSGDPKWEYSSQPDTMAHLVKEKKKTGDRRHCKWCGKYKPDRCHHCRVCKTCILKMDHHCPWIYNCVGFCNYKWFFLLLLYSWLACQFIFWTMMESVVRSVTQSMDFLPMFFLFFGETLALFMSVLVTSFWCFHVWLMFMAMTTIEFCEKSMPKKEEDSGGGSRYEGSAWSRGPYGNVCAVLGNNPLTWLLPMGGPPGDGMSYDMESARLLGPSGQKPANYGPQDTQDPFVTRDLEARRSIKKKSPGAEDMMAETVTYKGNAGPGWVSIF
mmetsp:Transcript_24844/g.78259  ORF Transcript_24844/g.78259 Transcript_24844/m.78259 type:complete len:356 (+) Transcript_24844:102-1169(+)